MKKTKNTFSTICLILLSIAIVFSLFLLAVFRENPNFFRRRMTEEDLMDWSRDMFRQIHFARRFYFDNNSGYVTENLEIVGVRYVPFYDIVFVETWQEGLDSDLPDNIIVAWPTPYSIGILEYVNYILARREVNWDYFDLSYPITMDDVIFRWENVMRIWSEFINRGLAHDYSNRHFGEVHEAYLIEIAEARRERGLSCPVWYPPWRE